MLLGLFLLAPHIIGCSNQTHPFAWMFFGSLAGLLSLVTFGLCAFGAFLSIKLIMEPITQSMGLFAIVLNFSFYVVSFLLLDSGELHYFCLLIPNTPNEYLV